MAVTPPSDPSPVHPTNSSQNNQTINFPNAAKNIQSYIHSSDFGYKAYQNNHMMSLQLITIYNASQAVAGKAPDFDTKYVSNGKVLTKVDFERFMHTIDNNLKHPVSNPASYQEAQQTLVHVLASTFDNVAGAQTAQNLFSDATDIDEFAFESDPLAPDSYQVISGMEHTEHLTAEVGEVKQQMGDFALQLITDRSTGFSEIAQDIANQMAQAPEKGSSYGKQLVQEYEQHQ
jgi:hypothetical protein